jgi:hypothetical protein
LASDIRRKPRNRISKGYDNSTVVTGMEGLPRKISVWQSFKHWRKYMPKYLLQGSYTAEGLRGLQKDTASARRDAVTQLVKSAGGSVECIYYAFGEQDVYCV